MQNTEAPGVPLAERLRTLREERQLSQEELAAQLHLTRQSISGWERGRSQPDIGTVQKLAGIYGISVDELLFGVQAETSQPSRWRWLFLVAALVLAAAVLFNMGFFLFQRVREWLTENTASIGIIGGADGPTAVFVTSRSPTSAFLASCWGFLNLSTALLGAFFLISWAPRKQPRPYKILGIILVGMAAVFWVPQAAGVFVWSSSLHQTMHPLLLVLLNSIDLTLHPGFWAPLLVGIFALTQHRKRKNAPKVPL